MLDRRIICWANIPWDAPVINANYENLFVHIMVFSEFLEPVSDASHQPKKNIARFRESWHISQNKETKQTLLTEQNDKTNETSKN